MTDLIKELHEEAECYRGTTQAKLLKAAARIQELTAYLQEALEFIDNESDVVDGDDGQPQANQAMALASEIERVLDRG